MMKRELVDAIVLPIYGIAILLALRTAYESAWFQGIMSSHGSNVAKYCSLTLSFVVFWTHSLILMAIDNFRPEWAIKYKVQADKFVSSEMTVKGIRVALFNILCIALPMSIVWNAVVLPWRGVDPDTPLPPWSRVIMDFAVFLLAVEVLFYYSHRIFHMKAFYATYHKMHHEFIAPIGVAAVYCTPLEMVIANLLPLMAGPTIMGSHITTTTAWFCLALINTVQTHSGYDFPFMASPRRHDFHHEAFTENFGVLGVLDTIHHTDTKFLARMEQEHQANLKPKAA
ncbi:hypothetical protein Ae201684P_002130 [Aphanomyces euteiches]|uniref:Fatty acid hydroxylase domain-containing protein n=1 Tax=Aphanomyces euteiches TaxID=100861 RepID=A0A6G0XK50_9STRA|nr:hypothetical protein Ae201684_003928 [Aphanomyces euteiches]KAH9084896.1 hypothetical protein Ae201684P_002130 [Aphanomyces euteiches]KAH9143076.1 hypothetical protein AeRB84_012899 [Aphanomyces euteiches]